MIVCNRCGKENQDHYKFCLGCGAELTSPAKPGGDIAVMKTMMADSSALHPGGPAPRPSGPTPSPFGAPMPPPPGGFPPGPAPHGGGFGPAPGFPPPHGAPPPGFGAPPAGPPGPLPPPGPLGPAPGPFGAPPPGPGPGMPPGPGLGMPPGPGPGMPPGPLGAPPSMGPPAGPPPGVPAPFGGAPAGFGAPPPQAAPAAGPRRCPSCGTDVPPGFRFCGACGQRMDDASQPVSAPVAVPPVAAAPRAMLTLIRPDGSEGGQHDLTQGINKIGRQFGTIFENDGYLSPTHAELDVAPTGAVVRDLGSLNGVFVKMTEEEEIQPGQVFRIGQELLRFDLVTPPEPMPDGTEVMGSPNPGYWGKVTVIIGKDVDGSAYPLLGESVTLGRERGEINFPDDGYVSGLHAKVATRDGKVYLSDLGSSNGTFIKIAHERALTSESFVLLGQQLFRLNL